MDLKGETKRNDKKNSYMYVCVAEGDEGFIKAILVGNEVVARLKARITYIS